MHEELRVKYPDWVMDFQSAMETFAEAWVAANTKTDPVQVIKTIFLKKTQNITRLYILKGFLATRVYFFTFYPINNMIFQREKKMYASIERNIFKMKLLQIKLILYVHLL